MKQLLILSLLVCLALQAGCTRGNESTEAAREPGRTTMTDSELKDQIEAKIKSDQQLRDANLSISTDADRNMVTLSGTVESEALRMRAADLAANAKPGLTIDNKIEVRPREANRGDYTAEQARQEQEKAKSNKETVGQSIDDAWIHAKIVAKLVTDGNIPERKINVDVENKVVTLRGNVDTPEQKEAAERIARETESVTRVNNQLKVVRGATTKG